MPHSVISNVAKSIFAHVKAKIIGEEATMTKLLGQEPGEFIDEEDMGDAIVVEADAMFSAHKNAIPIVETTAEQYVCM